MTESVITAPPPVEIQTSPAVKPEREALRSRVGRYAGNLLLGTAAFSTVATLAQGHPIGFAEAIGHGVSDPGHLSFDVDAAGGVIPRVSATHQGAPRHELRLVGQQLQDPADVKRVLVSPDKTVRFDTKGQMPLGEADLSLAEPSVKKMVSEIKSLQAQGFKVELVHAQGFASDEYSTAPNAGLEHRDAENQALANQRGEVAAAETNRLLKAAGIDVRVKTLPGKEIINHATDKQIEAIAREQGISVPALLGIMHGGDKLTAAEKKQKAELSSDRSEMLYMVAHRPAEYGTEKVQREPEGIVYSEKVTLPGEKNSGDVYLVPIPLPLIRRKKKTAEAEPLEDEPVQVPVQEVISREEIPVTVSRGRSHFTPRHSHAIERRSFAYAGPVGTVGHHIKQPRPHNAHGHARLNGGGYHARGGMPRTRGGDRH